MDAFLRKMNTCALLLLLVTLSDVDSTCNFPRFLKPNTMYRAVYTDGKYWTVYFNGDRISSSMAYLDDRERVTYDRRCLEEVESGKFLVEVKENSYNMDIPLKYSCMQFINRSEAVVQIKEPIDYLTVKSPLLCDESRMVLDNSPLIATPLPDNPKVKCPFTGGYNLKIVHKNRKLCMSEVIEPRMESECEEGDGITFDFRHSECLPESFQGRLKYDMYCIANWRQGKYTFTVLSDMMLSVPWCMRLQEPLDDLKQAHLFIDTICDPGDASGMFTTINMLILDLTKVIIPSACADEFEGCVDRRFCENFYKKYCHRSCGQCRDDVSLCNFPESLNGKWLLGESDGRTRAMQVDTYKIDVPGSGRFHCLAKNVSGNNDRIMLLHVFENGCYPRFACLEKKKYSKSTLLFRIGDRVNWPSFPIEETKVNTCKDDKFKVYTNTGNGYQNADMPMTTAVKASFFSSVDCQLPKDFGFLKGFLYFRDNSTNCDICFSHIPNNREEQFEVTAVNYTSCPRYPYAFACAASFNFSEIDVRAVITGTIQDLHGLPTEYLCWAFAGKNEKRKIVVLNSSDCNKLKIQRVLNGVDKPIRFFDIRDQERNLCTLAWPPRTYPERTVTTFIPPIRTTRPGNTYRTLDPPNKLGNMAYPNNRASSINTFTFALTICNFFLFFS